MVKWYNESLPRISRGFDYPWPHEYKNKRTKVRYFCSCGQEQPAGSRLCGNRKSF